MIELAKKINEELKENSVVKEYLSIKEKLVNNKEVNDLLDKILNKQNEMKEYLKSNDMKKYHEIKNEINELKKQFENIPLINNYMIIKEEVLSLIEQISKIIGD